MENSKVTRRSKLVTMEEAAGLVKDGMMIAVGGNHSHEAPCAFARELVRRGVKDLTVVPSNAAGYQIDLLIGGGCVKTLYNSYCGLDYVGAAPNFRRYAESGRLDVLELDEMGLMRGLKASAAGLAFYPLPDGILGVDVWFGNLNMGYIGEQKKPKYRGPGTVVTMATAWLNRVYLFTHSHSPRLFVEKVDFISGPGFIDGPEGRKKAGSPARAQGTRYIVTPICVFDFDEETKQARLNSVHPGHTVEEVKAKTGFKPIIPEKVPETEPPTEAELAFLRAFDADRIWPELC